MHGDINCIGQKFKQKGVSCVYLFILSSWVFRLKWSQEEKKKKQDKFWISIIGTVYHWILNLKETQLLAIDDDDELH